MKKLDAYIAKNVIMATLVVIVVIVALDSIFALIGEMEDLRGGYQLPQALQYISMRLPRRVYEYMSMACLVGCLAGLGSLAASSELTVMRAAGIPISRISLAVLKPTAVFMIISVLNAQYAIPNLERKAESLKTIALGQKEIMSNKGKGFWHREGNEYTRFSAADTNGTLYGISIYSFDEQKNLSKVRYAKKASYSDGAWTMENINQLDVYTDRTEASQKATEQWQSELTPRGLNVVMYEPRDMAITDLYNYSSYLKREGLNADKYLLSFWSKVNQPIGTFALVLLGISFIFGPLRAVTPGFRIFSGIMVGLIYKYAEELLAPISIISGFPTLLVTLVPTIVCFMMAYYMMRKVG